MKLMCSSFLLFLTFLSLSCDNGRGINSNPDDPTDLGEKHGKTATVMGVEVQYLEHQILEPKNASFKEIAVKYSVKNTTADILRFELRTEASFSDGSGIYKSSLGGPLLKDINLEKDRWSRPFQRQHDIDKENRWPSEIAPNGQMIGWQFSSVQEHIAKMKIKELATTIEVTNDKKMVTTTDIRSVPQRHLKLFVIE